MRPRLQTDRIVSLNGDIGVESEVLLAAPLTGDDRSHCRLCLWSSAARHAGDTETGEQEANTDRR